MAGDLRFRDFTPAERRRVVALTARMALPRADLRRLQRKVEAIEQQAERRKNGK
ncbi:hypothetical protein [Streptomyces sp. WAC 01325]|uniref:hypothetical protein n=1 Tax=Streptomyces sp. WAC 01325 TaxID=2203202 RepID=UPI00163BF0E6|nr:hypothetical protein [Streptomyces sp. WAC 01325]